MSYRLYRFQFFRPRPLFGEEIQWPDGGAREILDEALQTPLERQLTTRAYFTNKPQKIRNKAYQFRLARTGKQKISVREGERFSDLYVKDLPNVNVVVDTELELCAIQRNSRFSSNVSVSVNHLLKVLRASPPVRRYMAEVYLTELRDPGEFIDYIRSASRIRNFYFDVPRPNAHDRTKLAKALEEVTQEAGVPRARTSLLDGDVKKETAEDLARLSASTGNDSGAQVKLPGLERFLWKKFSKQAIDFQPSSTDDEEGLGVLEIMREIYDRIRNG